MVDQRFLDAPLRRERKASGRFRFLHVALLNSVKAHDNLIRALADRFRGDGSVELRIGGDGPPRPALERLARALGVQGQVRFLGELSREEVLEEMLGADAFVLCSRFETFGVVLAESLACGTPVIATACGGPECIVNESNGLLVPPGDVPALGQAMVTMRRRAAEYDAESLRRDCAARFGRDAVLATWRRLYEEAVARSRGA
jgi:glycosyltransferase involved in cell wall biosynthesis